MPVGYWGRSGVEAPLYDPLYIGGSMRRGSSLLPTEEGGGPHASGMIRSCWMARVNTLFRELLSSFRSAFRMVCMMV